MVIYYIILGCTTVLGGGLFIKWLAETEFGTKSLDSAPPRFNYMPDYFPFVVLGGWFLISIAGASLAERYTSKMADWGQNFAVYASYCLVEIGAIIFIAYAAKQYFVNGLSGFGIRYRGIFRDIISALGILITVWPLMAVLLLVVSYIGSYIAGPDFKMQQNPGMEVILQYPQLSVRILMFVFAALVTPVFEEMVFRGLLQSYFKNCILGPWTSIFLVSAIFSSLHPLMHFPAIFLLSAAMGYAYEKSGSLVRTMLLHCFFNSMQITMALFLQS
ncbi:MAG: CPBP family intramembrane glutamic endopeptidase [Phycisphaerales bacterium]